MKTVEYQGKVLYAIDNYNSEIKIKSNLKEILKLKKINSNDLSKITGLSKHRISEILNQNVIPKIDAILIIAYALNVSVETIYSLDNLDTYSIYQNDKNESVYLDNINNTILCHKEVRNNIKKNNKEYYDVETKELLSKKDYLEKTNTYKKNNFEKTYNKLVLKGNNKSISRKEAFKYLDELSSKKYRKIYTKLYEKSNLYKVD